MVEIIPAIMPKDLKDLEKNLSRFKGLVASVQVDVMDGRFVPSTDWPYIQGGQEAFQILVKGEEGLPFWQEFDFEVDLMVERPEEVIEDWMAVGVSRVIVHIESTEKFENIIKEVELYTTRITEEFVGAVSLGVALTTTTPLDAIEAYVDRVDFVQCMGIEKIGYQGQEFDPRVLEHISALRARHPELIISVDGGVSLETAGELAQAGANRLVSGSTLLTSNDIEATLEEFKALTD